MLGKRFGFSFAFCTALRARGVCAGASSSWVSPRCGLPRRFRGPWCAAWRLCALSSFSACRLLQSAFFFSSTSLWGFGSLRLVGRALRGPALFVGRLGVFHCLTVRVAGILLLSLGVNGFHVCDPRGRHFFRCRGFSSLTLEEEHFPWQRDAPSPRPRCPNIRHVPPQSARTGLSRAPRKCSPPVAATNAPDHCRSAGSEATLEKRPAGRRDCSAAFGKTPPQAPRPPKAFPFFLGTNHNWL